MKKIKAENLEHLKKLIINEMKLHGNECDLNHIDVSEINDMNYLFNKIRNFNGNISMWNTSNVTNMSGCFYNSQFNGDISNWNMSNVTTTAYMFYSSKFNGDINRWDVSNVRQMSFMFNKSQFKGDLSIWKPISCQIKNQMFKDCMAIIPYWAEYEDNISIKKAINSYWLEKKLQSSIGNNIKNKEIGKKVKL